MGVPPGRGVEAAPSPASFPWGDTQTPFWKVPRQGEEQASTPKWRTRRIQGRLGASPCDQHPPRDSRGRDSSAYRSRLWLQSRGWAQQPRGWEDVAVVLRGRVRGGEDWGSGTWSPIYPPELLWSQASTNVERDGAWCSFNTQHVSAPRWGWGSGSPWERAPSPGSRGVQASN